jgi:hypothetical protein
VRRQHDHVDNEAAFVPTLGTRYHLCAVDRDGTGKTRVYINGVVNSPAPGRSFAPPNSTANFTIGAIGNIDFPDVRL